MLIWLKHLNGLTMGNPMEEIFTKSTYMKADKIIFKSRNLFLN